MPDYYFQVMVTGFLLGCEKEPTEEEVIQYVREDIGALDIVIDKIKED